MREINHTPTRSGSSFANNWLTRWIAKSSFESNLFTLDGLYIMKGERKEGKSFCFKNELCHAVFSGIY